MTDAHEKRFRGEVERLRAPQRYEILQVEASVNAALADLPAESALDVGVGTGVFAELFAQRGLRVGGVDVREDMLAEALRYVPNGDFRLAPAEALPFEDKSFDLVFGGLVYHEVDDLGKALAEARRVARRRVAILEWRYMAEAPMGPPLEHRLDPALLRQSAQAQGYTSVDETLFEQVILYRLKP